MKGQRAQRYSSALSWTKWVWVVKDTPWPLYHQERNSVPILVQDAGWATGPVWTSAENLIHTGIWSSDRPARSEPLYRPSRWELHIRKYWPLMPWECEHRSVNNRS